ncbi:MAG TPA: DUF1775 domain-containing protein [Gaiellaceae bacterium]|nr:DUF1775 domain-containing protein [Gaiellaceae bacterium]
MALVFAGIAAAHARVSPAVSVSGELQLYSLAVPTEKENLTTKAIELTLPNGFSIDSFVPNPGWTRTSTDTTVTWAGGSTPTEEDSLFQFLAQPAKSGTYTFEVKQTYSDGSVVRWSDPESGADPAPTITVKSSLGGGSGTSTLSIVALVLGAAGILIGGLALVSRSGRQLT